MKLLLTNMNTQWGVIVNPHSDNTYGHVLSFESQAIKDQFITKYLTDNQDYKTLLKSQPEQVILNESSTIISFRVNPKTYNKTYTELMNKDFVIVEDMDEKISFYAISSAKRIGSIIEYTAELDIFFTYDIKDMFNNNKVRIKQAMADRFVISDVGGGVPSLLNMKYGDLERKTGIFTNESFDSNISEITIPVTEPKRVYIDYTKFMDSKTLENSAEVNRLLNKLTWNVVSYNHSDSGSFALDLISPFSRVPYFTTSTPVLLVDNFEDTSYNQIEVKILNKDGSKITMLPRESLEAYKGSLTDPNLMKNTLRETNIPPFAHFLDKWDKTQLEIKFVQSDGNTPESNVYELLLKPQLDTITFDSGQDVNGINVMHYKFSTSAKPALTFLVDNNNGIQAPAEIPEVELVTDFNLSLEDYTGININQKVTGSHPYEIKTDFAPYTIYKLKSMFKDSFDIHSQDIYETSIKLKGNYGYLPDVYSAFYRIHGLNTIGTNQEYLSYEENEYFEILNNASLPTETNAFEEYNIRNKSQMNTNMTKTAITAAIGGLSVLAAPFTGGASLAVGLGAGIAGISIAAKASGEIASQLAMKRDLKATPNQMNNGGATYFVDSSLKKPLSVTKYELPPKEMLLVKEHFYKYGYNFNNRLYDINEYLTNRYYFNYIEAQDTFENIKLQLSSEIKQLISSTLEQGVTIWSVRDLNRYKGIKNYDYENLEMSVLNHVVKKRKGK